MTEATNLLALPGQITKVGVILPANLTYEQWEKVGHNMRGVRESIKFYLGDWLNYGETVYGEKYAQALDGTDFDYDYLRNIAYVCRKVPLSLRSDNLTFGHHQAVAALANEDQSFFLAEATKNDWSVKDLNHAIKAWRKEQEDNEPPPAPPGKKNYSVNVIVTHTYNGTVQAEGVEDAEDQAVKAAIKSLDKDSDEQFTVNVRVLEEK